MSALTYTSEEAAARIGVGINWLRTQARDGKVPHRRFGRLYKFTDDDIDEIVEQCKWSPRSTEPSGLSPRSARRLDVAS